MKTRVEFDGYNLDLDDKRCRSLSRQIANAFKEVETVREKSSAEF